jgi:hypothetical protein
MSFVLAGAIVVARVSLNDTAIPIEQKESCWLFKRVVESFRHEDGVVPDDVPVCVPFISGVAVANAANDTGFEEFKAEKAAIMITPVITFLDGSRLAA